MSRTRRLLQLVLALALATSIQSQAAARGAGGDSPPPPSIARVETSASRVDWSPVLGVGNDPIILTIAGPQGFYFEKRFPRGTPLAFDLADVRDRNLPDGTYSYELRTMGKGAGRVQPGFLSVRDGKIFVPATGVGGTEPPPAGKKPSGSPLPLKVSQTNTCIGDGCGGSDSGSPLQLKSSLVRLDFTDVTDGVTEDHDWAIEANAALGGGAYLAFLDRGDTFTRPFKVVAGAPDDSLLVSSSGKVGVGTAAPAVQLDAKVTSSGNAVARLQNLSSSGYSAIEYLDQSGNVDLFFGIDNANSTTRLNSVNNNPIVVLTNGTERMRVTSAGDVGIGTASPTNQFDLRCNDPGTTCGIVGNSSSTGFSGWEFARADGAVVANVSVNNGAANTRFNSAQNYPIVIMTESTERMRFTSDGKISIGGVTSPTHPIQHSNGAHLTSGGVWTDASSRVLKQDIHDLDAGAALTALRNLKPVEFAYKADPAEHHVGFIAEDVPTLVAENDRKGLSPMDVVAVLTKVVQEQQKTIEALTAQMQEMQRNP